MQFSIHILGTEVFAVSLGPECPGEAPEGWNGSSHTNGVYERDTEPLRADHGEPYYEEDVVHRRSSGVSRSAPIGFTIN